MTSSRTSTAAQEWISHDPDPQTAAELAALSDEELDERFAQPLTFGTAGLRGPLRGGPNGMNLAVVLRTTWAVAKVLKDRGLAGSHVVVGRDARHGSEEFALAAAEVLAAQGFPVTLMFAAVPTPVVAFAVRHRRRGGGHPDHRVAQPAVRQRLQGVLRGRVPDRAAHRPGNRTAIAAAPLRRRDPPAARRAHPVSSWFSATSSVRPQVRHTHGSVRVALTPMHGVGGEFAMDALVRAGFTDVHVVESQFAPDPDFPTVAFPNPEEPGAVDALLQLAADVDAEIAIALDPDADRCAVGVPTPAGWRMLSGDETGWLLGDYILSQIEPGPVSEATVVASTRGVVAHAGRHRQGPRRPARRDTDRVQVVVASRRRSARLHARLRVRGGDRPLRRSGRGPRQGRHQRGRARVRSGCRAAGSRAARCSTRSTTWRAATACTPRPRCRDASPTPTRPKR